MLGARRRAAVLLALAASLAPWLAAGALTAHLESHALGAAASHDLHHLEFGDGLALALHGHDHEAGTPAHEHPLTFAAGAATATRTQAAPLPAAAHEFGPVVSPGELLGGCASLRGHGPSRGRPALRVLRI